MINFLAEVFKQNPGLTATLCSKISLETNLQESIVLGALRHANTSESLQYLNDFQEKAKKEQDTQTYELISTLKKDPPYDTMTTPIIDALDLDMIWASFFATGNEAYIKRIVSVSLQDLVKEDALNLVVVSARWSLRENIRQHTKVRKICEDLVTQVTKEQSKIIELLLKP